MLRALDARWVTLQKEQEMAFGRAIAAGFIIKHVGDLVLFAESFGAHRLRYIICDCSLLYNLMGMSFEMVAI